MGMKVLILAARRTGYNAVQHLLEAGKHQVVGVISKDYDALVNDGIACSDFAALLQKRAVPFWVMDNIHEPEMVEQIKKLVPDVGLSIGWRRLVKEPTISIPPMGFINFHTSDLPKYRGFASTSWAILNGDDHVAITAHRMVSGQADRGDILLKELIPITPEMDIGILFQHIESIIPRMVMRLLDQMEAGTVRPISQDETEAVFSFPRHPADGWIDWLKSAVEIDRLVRSIAKPYPGAFTSWNMQKIIVWRGHVLLNFPSWVGVPGHVIGSDDNLSIKVLTGGGIYVITEIQVEGSDETISPAPLIKGVQQRLGMSQGELFEILTSLLEMKKNI